MSFIETKNGGIIPAPEEYIPSNAVRACAYSTKGNGVGCQTVIRIRLADGSTVVHLPNCPLGHVGGGWDIPFRFVEMEEADFYLRFGFTKKDSRARLAGMRARAMLKSLRASGA